MKYKGLIDSIKKIINSFFTLYKKNNLLIVEALFRFSDKSIKD